MIYLDTASTKKMNTLAKIGYEFASENAWGNPSNNYSLSNISKSMLNTAKEVIANSLSCNSDEIFFTSGASEGNAFICNQGEVIYCSPYEHHNYDNRKTVKVEDLESFFSLVLKEDVNWVVKEKYSKSVYAHTLVNSITGEIFDVNKDFTIARKLNMITAMDITQAYGNMLINIKEYDCDIAVTSAHKFGGPRGVGFMYIRREAQSKMKPLIYGSQQKQLRGGTENLPAIYGMSLVVPTAESITKQINHCKNIREIIKNKLTNSGLEYRINEGKNNLPSTINFSLKNIESELIQAILSDKQIYIGVGSACNDGSMPLDPTLVAMKVPTEFIHGPIRLSYDYNTPLKDVEIAMNEIINIYKELKSIES